ncbi:MAG: hypothetical protein ACAI44_32695 [Candidatus Sericytochromatia bacterium]
MKRLLPALLLFTLISGCASGPVLPPSGARVMLRQAATTPANGTVTPEAGRLTAVRDFKAQINTGEKFVRVSAEYDVLYGQKSATRRVAFFYHPDKTISNLTLLGGEAAPLPQINEECLAIMRLPIG